MGLPTKRVRLDGDTLPPHCYYIVLLFAYTKPQSRDKTTTKETPLDVASLEGGLSFGVNIAARPIFSFGVLVGGWSAAVIDAGFELDLPKVFTKFTAVKSTSSTPLLILPS